jgi:hypothetical protein
MYIEYGANDKKPVPQKKFPAAPVKFFEFSAQLPFDLLQKLVYIAAAGKTVVENAADALAESLPAVALLFAPLLPAVALLLAPLFDVLT